MNSITAATNAYKQYKTNTKNMSIIAKVRNAHTIMAGLKMISNAHKNNSMIIGSNPFNVITVNTTQSDTLILIIFNLIFMPMYNTKPTCNL